MVKIKGADGECNINDQPGEASAQLLKVQSKRGDLHRRFSGEFMRSGAITGWASVLLNAEDSPAGGTVTELLLRNVQKSILEKLNLSPEARTTLFRTLSRIQTRTGAIPIQSSGGSVISNPQRDRARERALAERDFRVYDGA
jgi:hypothetical protein